MKARRCGSFAAIVTVLLAATAGYAQVSGKCVYNCGSPTPPPSSSSESAGGYSGSGYSTFGASVFNAAFEAARRAAQRRAQEKAEQEELARQQKEAEEQARRIEEARAAESHRQLLSNLRRPGTAIDAGGQEPLRGLRRMDGEAPAPQSNLDLLRRADRDVAAQPSSNIGSIRFRDAMDQLEQAAAYGEQARQTSNEASAALASRVFDTPPEQRLTPPRPEIPPTQAARMTVADFDRRLQDNQARREALTSEIDRLSRDRTPGNAAREAEKRIELGRLEQEKNYLEFRRKELLDLSRLDGDLPLPVGPAPGSNQLVEQ